MMTSRERILATLRHERPDRVPIDLWLRRETTEALKDRLGCENVRDALGLDWYGGGHVGETWTGWAERPDVEVRRGDHPGAGKAVRWLDERTFEEPWGWAQRIGTDGKYLEWVRGPLSDVDPASREAMERIESIVPPHTLTPHDEVKTRAEKAKAEGRIVTGGFALPFKNAWHLRGMENLLCDFLINKEFAHALLDKLYEHQIEIARRMAAAGVDIVQVIGDVAGQDRLMFSHDVFEEFMKPRMKRLVETARAAAPPGHTVHFFYHCDGNMWGVLGDYVDDLGFDIVNPIQPECMDCYEAKKVYGDRVTLHGTMSVVDLLPKGPVERIRRVVRERIDGLAYNGGFILCSANAITYDTPVEHVLAMVEEARAYTSDQWPTD